MANIVLQDLIVTIHGTSRLNGNQFDIVHVETLLQTNEPLTDGLAWYVPTGTSVPSEILEIFKATNLAMYPMAESEVLSGTEDILQQAQQGNLPEVEIDAAKLMLRAIMKKTTLTPVSGANNLYILSYDYKLFPLKEAQNMFDFKVVLPFSGLGMVGGSKVQMAVILPINSSIDPDVTKGVALNGQEINELIQPVGSTGHSILSFEYTVTDPLFTIRYKY